MCQLPHQMQWLASSQSAVRSQETCRRFLLVFCLASAQMHACVLVRVVGSTKGLTITFSVVFSHMLLACYADYLTKVVVLGKNSTKINVASIMTPQSKLMTVSPDSSVLEVMALMVNNNFRHVPVVSSPLLLLGRLLYFQTTLECHVLDFCLWNETSWCSDG